MRRSASTLLVISHAYADEENQKNLDALAKHHRVYAAVPRRTGISLFADHHAVASCTRASVRPMSTLHVTPSQYVFLSPGYGLGSAVPDAILVEYNPWSLVFLQAALLRKAWYTRARLICLVKKNTFRGQPRALYELKRRVAPPLVAAADHFIAASSLAASMLHEELAVGLNRISVAQHLGVDTRAFRPANRAARDSAAPADPVTVGFCGRLDADKGVLELVEAVREVRTQTSRNVVLSLLGEGSLTERLRDMAGAAPWLRIKGAVRHDRVPDFLRSLDVFAFPSQPAADHEEHDAHALLEAMACGLPCIATEVGRIPDVLDDDCGLLVARRDFGALVQGLGRLVSHADERAAKGRRARAAVCRRFSLERLAERKAAIISEVIGR